MSGSKQPTKPELRRSSWLPIPSYRNWPGMSRARATSAQRRRLDLEELPPHHCLFGGGTAIALGYGEFRQSVGLDLLVSDRQGYRELRQLIR